MHSQRAVRACLAVWALTGPALAWAASQPPVTISLAGEWRFALDQNKEGRQKEFFKSDLPGRIALPGSTDEAKAGIPNPAKPSLDGLYRPNLYEGLAWYQRDIDVPAGWKGKRILLSLERVHWDTFVWVNDQYVGTRDTLIAPHVYELPSGLASGKHRLTTLDRADEDSFVVLSTIAGLLARMVANAARHRGERHVFFDERIGIQILAALHQV